MIIKINQSYLIPEIRELVEYGLELGKMVAKNKKQPFYPTPSGMNIKIPQNPFLECTGSARINKSHKNIAHDSILFSIPGYTKDKGIEFFPGYKEDIMLDIIKPRKHDWRTALDIDDIDVNTIDSLRVKIGEFVTPPHFARALPQLEPHYYIDELLSGGKNTGTNAIKSVVLESLNDTQTQGRVLLDACCIDGKTSPAGFYYKLGFRSTNPDANSELANWLAEGGKKDNAPWCMGMMYLPKENIQHCLNYGLDIKA